MIRPLLRAERARWRPPGVAWPWLAGVAVGFAILDLLWLRVGLSSSLGEPESLRGVVRAGVLAQCLLLAVVAPALGVVAGNRRRRSQELLFLGVWRSATVIAARAMMPLARALVLVVASGLALWPLAWLLGDGWILARLAMSQLELACMAAVFVALGLLCSTQLRSASSAAAVAYLMVLIMLAAPLAIGPAVARRPGAEGVINVALVTSPITSLAAALEFDLMRSEIVYRLSPIGQRRFRYPTSSTVLALQAGFLGLAFAGSVWSFSRQRRGRRF